MQVSESAGTVPWRKTPWFWRSVALAVPFGFVTIVTLAEAFLTDPSRGWRLVLGSLGIVLALYGLAVMAYRFPVLKQAWAVRRADPLAIAVVARRSLTTSPALSAVARRPALTRSKDECFLVVVRESDVEFQGFDPATPPTRLELGDIEAVSVARERMFTGTSNVLAIRFTQAEAPVTFAVFDDRVLCAVEMRSKRLEDLRAVIAARSEAARPDHSSSRARA